MSVENSALDVERSAPRDAVFLSYASQDVEAAKKICDALRAADVEVWFDQSELVGGDAWDQKIRGRIGSCALFLPVISVNTQARLEGYFRMEWKIAAQRTYAMADEKVFLLPVVIDGTREVEARVPAEFKSVQWTKLPGGETPPAFVARVKKLLAGEAVTETFTPPHPGGASRHGPSKWWWVLPLFGVTMALVLMMKESRHDPAPPPAAVTATPGAAATMSEARQFVAKARAMSLDKYDSTADDFAAAESLVKRALELDPNDAQIWAVSSLLNFAFQSRGIDHAPARMAAARSQAERALSLDPGSLEGLFALGRWQRDNEDPAVAEATFKKILARDPNHPGALGGLAWLYDRMDRVDDAAELYDRLATRPGGNAALARYTEFLLYFHRARFAEADRCIRQSVASQLSSNSQAMLALLLLTWKGDADGATRVLASGPTAVRNEPRTIWTTALMQLCQRAPEEALKTLDRFSDDYIQDNWFAGPKTYFTGQAHALAGRKEAARLAWEAGLAVIDARLKATPESRDLHLMRGELLACLGRTDEAVREARTLTELKRLYNSGWFDSEARIYALLGRADEALPLLEKYLATPVGVNVGWPLTPALLRLDPLWDKIRDDPRFKKLLADAEAKVLASAPARDWPKDPELKKAIAPLDRLNAIPEDIRLAEEIAQRVLDRSPTDAETLTVMARVHSTWLLRGWDRSTARYQKAASTAERALQLAPDEPEALAALATCLYTRGSEPQRALDLSQRAVDLAPQEPRFHRLRDNCLFTLNFNPSDVFMELNVERPNPGLERALASARRTVELFPADALVRYELARHYRDVGRWAEFEQATDATLALAPVANAIVWKARARLGLHGDLAGMKALLDQVPARVRAIERTVFSYFLYSAFTGGTREGLDALNSLTDDWMIDFDYRGPKALPVGALHELQGKKELARIQYELAFAELQRARSANPSDTQSYLVEAWIQHGLGRDSEARAALRIFNESLPRPYTMSPMGTWWFQAIAANLLMGERATALALIREAGAGPAEGRATIRNRLVLDRRMAPFRDDPEITALLAGPAAKK